MIALLPCRCGADPTVCKRAQGHNTYFVMCRCDRRGREKTTPEAAAASWNEDAEKAARQALDREARRLRRQATAFAKDPAFVEAVVSRFVRIGSLNGTAAAYHVMRLTVDGVDREANVRALVDGFLAHQWPELLKLVDPESVVHRVLREAGHPVFTMAHKTKGPNLEPHVRAAPHVGEPIAPEVVTA